jgi:hypothetical protein
MSPSQVVVVVNHGSYLQGHLEVLPVVVLLAAVALLAAAALLVVLLAVLV